MEPTSVFTLCHARECVMLQKKTGGSQVFLNHPQAQVHHTASEPGSGKEDYREICVAWQPFCLSFHLAAEWLAMAG